MRTLNIQGSQGLGLALAIWSVERLSFAVMLLTKTKIQSVAYSDNFLGYNVNFLTAPPPP